MRSGNRDIRLQSHQFGEHLGPTHDRQPSASGGIQFGIARLDRGGNHDDLCPFEVFSPLSFEDRRAETLEPFGNL